jgi:hypothetical protein
MAKKALTVYRDTDALAFTSPQDHPEGLWYPVRARDDRYEIVRRVDAVDVRLHPERAAYLGAYISVNDTFFHATRKRVCAG